MRFALALVVCLAIPTVATATPSVLRDGANHHLGDDSFVATFGRLPTATDTEELRMHVHLVYVRELLGHREATSPALEGRRRELLGYLDDYIAKGVTPRNTYVARRNPVFIDRDGNICAVGYLIERSVGRALPERIAATHRLDYLEDIAAAMPEVASWAASSGFTLDELASIQPGYQGPDVQHQEGWLVAGDSDDSGMGYRIGTTIPDDGPYRDEATGTVGRFARGKMVGRWTRTVKGKVLGRGTFVRGTGTWTSFRADGSVLAKGPFANNRAHGTWRFFHPSGRLAATGPMVKGKRSGRWSLFYDRPGRHPLSVGGFRDGEAGGRWRHYGPDGTLVARTDGKPWHGLTLHIEPGPDRVRHTIHHEIMSERLDGFTLGTTHLYVDGEAMYDDRGNALEHAGTTWTARSCAWPARGRRAVRRGDVARLHDLLFGNPETAVGTISRDCDGAPRRVSAALGRRYDRMLATRRVLHAKIPAFELSGNGPAPADSSSDSEPDVTDSDDNDDDFGIYLARHMSWYVEWPHVDDSFRTVYASLPGY